MNPFKHPRLVKRYWQMLGPGLVTGAADDDPSGVATYSQAGALYGLQLIWMSVYTLPLMIAIQEMCARIGMVSGRGLAENIRREYPRWALYLCVVLLLGANTFNIGADLGAMAASVQLLWPAADFAVVVFAFAICSLLLQIFTPYRIYARYLKYLALVLLSYVATGLIVNLEWGNVLLHAIVPSLDFSRESFFIVCAVLGTTISPYLFFWQTSQEVEEEIQSGSTTIRARAGATDADIRDMRIDVSSGMIISNIVMFFIIAVCAETLFAHGIDGIETAADAAAALVPLVGEWASAFFALGIIGTGMLSIPVFAGANGYALAETFHWHEGLYRRFRSALGFYLTIAASMIVALGLNFIGIDPIKALIYSAVANGIVAPVVLFFIVRLSDDPKIMGDRVNGPLIRMLGWLTFFAMTLSGIAVILSFFI
ncbi:divalent metal cation transporter [Candidatus Kaiserbacteria bacterium]|nr:divalent metal cation transporter [Candidatus Kaiserbacteria bacterium]